MRILSPIIDGMSKTDSEFGAGFIYPLSLFLCHADRLREDIEKFKKIDMPGFNADRAAQLWLYGAADHLYQFDPTHAPTRELYRRCSLFRRRVLFHRLEWKPTYNKLTVHGAFVLIEQAKTLMLEIDRILGVPAVEAQWA